MSDLDDLYQDMLKDHSRSPRNFRVMPDATGHADGHNRLCGDKLRLFVKLDGDIIRDVSFQGDGCAISKASASIMSETLKGKTLADAEKLFARFHGVVTGPPDEEPDTTDLGKLAVFRGVRKFPVRVKCATLCWHTFQAALKNDQAAVSTE
jgi:nitrogen fixation NifU-like protein